MRTFFLGLVTLAMVLSAPAAERSFHFGGYALDRIPPGFRSLLAGDGKPGEWKVIADEAPSALQKISDRAPVTSKHNVLAQLSRDATDERFPILIFDEETYGDFTLTTRFKLVDGLTEQMAGIVFRLQDEKNFYVVRASGLGNNLRFYKMVSGIRSNPLGPETKISVGEWHELKVECKGNQIRFGLDGNELGPPLTDNSFTAGKIGFWTKSDSVTYFGETDMTYTPRVPLAQLMVNDIMKQYPRLRGMKIFAPDAATGTLKAIAANEDLFLNQAGTEVEEKTFKTGAIFQTKERGAETVTVVTPLHDRNGETVAAVHIVMESFPGQTEQNVLARTLPIMKQMQARIISAKDLAE
jgi:hypothetical protein